MSADTGSSTHRGAIYAALGRRNSIIRWLRVGVPIFGGLVLLVLVGQILIANIASQFLPDGVRLAKDRLVIDAPTYSGVMQDGTKYTVSSREATASIDNTDLIDLTGARIELVRPDGSVIFADSEQGQFGFSSQRIDVPGLMHVRDSEGAVADLNNVLFDWSAQTMDVRGAAHIVFSDGTTLDSATLFYDANSETWDFSGVTLVVPAQGEGQ